MVLRTPASYCSRMAQVESNTTNELGRREFIALVSTMIATSALAIDLVLPALADVRVEFGLASDSSAVTWIITAFFVGLAVGQPFYGPVADRFGRRFSLYLSVSMYVAAAIASALAPSLGFMIVSRFIWGLGAAGTRVTATALVRDRYQGTDMARAMSFIMSVFLVVPVIAPTVGAVILDVSSWRWTFLGGAVVAILMALWATRLPETLNPEDRREIRFGPTLAATKTVFTTRRTIGYTLAQTFLMGGFLSFLASSEKIFGELYDQADRFPQLFGLVAATMALGTLSNSRIVPRVGMVNLVRGGIIVFVGSAALMSVLTLATDGLPPLALFVIALLMVSGTQALLIPNFAAISMTPVGHIAGMASAITGTIFMGGGAILGSILDRLLDDTVTPLAFGFLIYGVIALSLVLWTERTSAQPM